MGGIILMLVHLAVLAARGVGALLVALLAARRVQVTQCAVRGDELEGLAVVAVARLAGIIQIVAVVVGVLAA